MSYTTKRPLLHYLIQQKTNSRDRLEFVADRLIAKLKSEHGVTVTRAALMTYARGSRRPRPGPVSKALAKATGIDELTILGSPPESSVSAA